MTPEARFQIIMELLDPNVYDEEGNIVGQKTPIITREEALELLDFPSIVE